MRTEERNSVVAEAKECSAYKPDYALNPSTPGMSIQIGNSQEGSRRSNRVRFLGAQNKQETKKTIGQIKTGVQMMAMAVLHYI